MHLRGLVRRLQAVLPRSDIPGARQPTPYGLNRYVLLLFYGAYGCLTAAVFFGWPAMAAILVRNEGFSNLCARDPVTGEYINDLRKTANKLYICDEQDAAVQKLYPLTGAFCCAMSGCGGALLDWIGPRWTACFGQTLTIIGWLLLAFGGQGSTPYVVGMAFIGLGADAGFLPTLCVTRIFPGASGFVITFLGSASTASSAVPLVLLALMEQHGATLKQAALGYIGVGPCFAILVALLLLPVKNFLVDTDAPTLPNGEQTSRENLEEGTASRLQRVVAADETGKNRSRSPKYLWPGSKRRFLGGKRPLPVVETSWKRRLSLAGGGGRLARGEAAEEDRLENELEERSGSLDFEMQQTESTAAGGREVFVPERSAALAASSLHSPDVSPAAVIHGQKGEEEEKEEEEHQLQTQVEGRRGAAGAWAADNFNIVSWAGREESTSASAGSAEEEGVCGGDVALQEAEEEEAGGGRLAGDNRTIHQGNARGQAHEEAGDGVGRGHDGVLTTLEEEVNKSKKSGFLHQALSRRYLVIVIYFIGVSWAGAFYQQAPRRMFSDRVVWIMELLQPFGSIPCIILGRLSDMFGILKIIGIVNTFGLLMYVLSLGKSDICGYISVICFTVYLSLFTSQVFIYIEKTFSPVHFGRLIGITVLVGGLLSFVCNPLYESVVVNRNKGDPLVVQIAMVVLMCVQYVWIAFLFYLKKENPHPYRDSPRLADAIRETTEPAAV